MKVRKEEITTEKLKLQPISDLQPETTFPKWPEKPQAKNLIESDPRQVTLQSTWQKEIVNPL